MRTRAKRSNCVFVACRLWWRHGGYLLVRRSVFRRFSIRAAWSPDAYRFVAWVPKVPIDGWWPGVWFEGKFQRWRGVELVHPGRRRVGYVAGAARAARESAARRDAR